MLDKIMGFRYRAQEDHTAMPTCQREAGVSEQQTWKNKQNFLMNLYREKEKNPVVLKRRSNP